MTDPVCAARGARPRVTRRFSRAWQARLVPLVWLAAIVAIGLNLRPLLTSISPLLPSIRAATGLSYAGAALLTSLPVVAMGLGAFAAGPLARGLGETRGVALGLLAIALACGARWRADSGAALLASATLAGIGVAAIQALLPGVIKLRFGHRVPLAMGIFSAALMGGGGLGARLSPALSRWAGTWHAGLAFWALPALLALAGWLALGRCTGRAATGATGAAGAADTADTARPAHPGEHSPVTHASHDSHAPHAASHASHAPHTSHTPHAADGAPLWRRRRAWTLGLHFGLVNGGYTTLVAWLPAYYQQQGASVAQSGALLATMTLFQAAAAVLLPLAAAPFRDRRPWLVLGLAAQLAGIAGLALWPLGAPLLWVASAGAGLGGTFALTLVTALDHAEAPRLAARIAAFMQGVGFVIAAIAPLVAGVLREATGTFRAAWLLLALTLCAMIVLTRVLSPRSYARAFGPAHAWARAAG
jgi:CP family cyanate transporter-like MFS transporter